MVRLVRRLFEIDENRVTAQLKPMSTHTTKIFVNLPVKDLRVFFMDPSHVQQANMTSL